MNLTSGAVTEFVAAAASAPNKPASPGGASMPRLSPDGQTLAFVRRMQWSCRVVLLTNAHESSLMDSHGMAEL